MPGIIAMMIVALFFITLWKVFDMIEDIFEIFNKLEQDMGRKIFDPMLNWICEGDKKENKNE